jgi:hypothetical protein
MFTEVIKYLENNPCDFNKKQGDRISQKTGINDV